MEEHFCTKNNPKWPASSWECYTQDNNLRLSVNMEYGVEVKFCPFCGYNADNRVEKRAER